MPSSFKYSASAQTQALKKGDWWIGTGDVGKGPTSTTDYWNGITPANGGYVVVVNKGANGPALFSATTDAALISLTNRIAGTSYSTVNECFNYFNGQTDKLVINKDCNSFITNGLVMNLDASFLPSYPRNGSTWYDLSGNGNNGSINSGEFNSGNDGYLRNLNNESNFFYVTVPNSASINSTFSVTTGGWTIEEIIWTNSTTYPEADAGSVISDNAYSIANTGFDWNHGYGITSFQFGQSTNAGGYYDDVVVTSIPSQYAQLNTWRIRTMVWDRGNNFNSLYINGVYIGGGSTPNTAGESVYDGGGCSFGTLYGWKFYGRRGAIKVWNRVLSASEVLQNFNAQKGTYGL